MEPSTTTAITNQRTITVSGLGRNAVTPDVAQVMLGVQSENRDLTTAQQEANQTMHAIIGTLREQGVPEERIKTINYTVSIQRDHTKPDAPITDFQVAHVLQIKIKPIVDLGAILNAAVARGANVIHGAQFMVENPEAALRQAREQAMQEVRAKAEQLATLAGVSLGPPLTILESLNQPFPIHVMAPPAVRLAHTPSPAVVPIQPGESELVVNVTVSYAIA
ncbi:SIMPL domain-containing protein [Nitrolancea hollandica]|uniref:26 kDa periplasmic immunogenic protein n=1 Tax=Nitrolancea hollandica Lb TaxID=1129897 RepID=I4EL68_9BACT|nr:SIMPL domain-containing protein [Nitrolancea hollandica]CCF85430.1 conserved hypothetical protein [Nitrolancea hollandica Lb]